MLDTATLSARIDEILAAHLGREGALLPILHDVQADFGYIPDVCLPQIAQALNISRAEVHGVVSFYHDFRAAPAGKHTVKLCRAEACQAMGGDGLQSYIRAKLGIDWHETTPDGRVTLEPVFCLGLCACAPAAMVDGKLMGSVDAAKIDTVLGDLA
jgi:formate dehydrogenase subunit gamma